jgi:hypothetical protein
MISTITVDLVKGNRFHYLTGQSTIKDFKNVELETYYDEDFKYIDCTAILPIDEFLKAVNLNKEDISYETSYYFECTVQGIELSLPGGRVNRISNTEVDIYFSDVQLKVSKSYKVLVEWY